jgi:hypothetical protein
VKNLKKVVLSFSDGPSPGLVATFAPNEWMHTESLVIEYSRVSALSLEVEGLSEAEDSAGLGRVLLDEILPTTTGCTHEIRFADGSLLVSCADLKVEWREIEE